ncbi:Golgi-associated RAB2 interactor protein 5B isoform X1 [Canis lupus baileyi]|uniref:Golgi-associated RAB2 interactor protein 5B isoform X1 n=2 Tax=Canis lupus baileyi TaxID=143281 RepID=UPI003B9713B0
MNRFRNMRRMEPFQGPSKWVPTLGELQKTLQKGEYLPLRPLPMFESNFVQVTNRGAPVYVHHRTNRLTMGVAASLPGLVLPDILLIAQPPEGKECSNLVLTRMLPLDLAHLYVHDLSAWRLKLRLVTGRYYYLELDAPDKEVGFLFDRWIRLINLLQEPATTWAPRTLNTPTTDLAHVVPPASTWRLQAQPQSKRSVMIVEPTFPYKLLASQRQKKAKTLKRKFKSQAVGDSVPLIWSQMEHAKAKKKSAEKSQPHLHPDRSQTQIQISEKPSITIRTIFSIISNTINHTQSSSKPCSSDSDLGTVLGGLVETPVRCISEESAGPSLAGSYENLDPYLWQQDIEHLIDPDSSTLSSSSFSPAPGPPAFYLRAPYSSFRKHKERPRVPGSGQRQRLPPSQKTQSIRATSWKVPFILDQSKKVSAAHAPTQKTSTGAGPSRRVPVAPAASQKAPVTRGPSRKVPPALATSQKAPTIHGSARKAPPAPAISRKAPVVSVPSRKAPPGLAIPQKATAIPVLSQKAQPIPALPPKTAPHTVRNRKSLFLPTPSQRALISPTQDQGTLDEVDLGMLPRLGSMRNVPKRSKREGMPEPMMFVSTHEMDLVETRTKKTSLELPFTTTERESSEVVISKAHEINVDGLKGRSWLEDKVQRKKEERALDIPGFKSKEMRQQHKWLKTEELTIEGPPEEQSRPFSVEGLTLAKLIIMANSKEPPQRPPVVRLPSWLSVAQVSAMPTESTVPTKPHKEPPAEKTPVVAKEKPPVHTWVPPPEKTPVVAKEKPPVHTWVPPPEKTPVVAKEKPPVHTWVPPPEKTLVAAREQSPVRSWVPSPEKTPVAAKEQSLLDSWVSSSEGTSVEAKEQSPVRSWVPSSEGTPVAAKEQSPAQSWVPSSEGTPGVAKEQSPARSWISSLEGAPGAAREQSQVSPWVKGKMHEWAEKSKHSWVEQEAKVERSSQDSTGPSEVYYLHELESSSRNTDTASPPPIPLPASEWESTPQSPMSLSPISKMEPGISSESSVPQEPQELKEMSDHSPLTITDLSSEVLPSPLEAESVTDVATSGEKTDELDAFSPSASMHSWESPQ